MADALKFSRMEGGAEMAAVLRELPEQLQRNALRSTARAGALELQRVSYAYLSLAMKRSAREDDVIIKQRRSAKGGTAVEYVVGPPRRKPWLRWLHNGTHSHIISAVMRHGTRRGARNTPVAAVWLDNGDVKTLRRRGRRVTADVLRTGRKVLVLADKAAGKFFGKTITHPGQPPRPWLKTAQFAANESVFRVMAEHMRKALPKQAKRLVSTKYRNQQLWRIFR